MAYNRNLVTGTRNTRDSVKKQQYRQTKFDSAPRIALQDLADGMYKIRFWPEDPKNPHGYLDNRVHKVPQGYIQENVDPRWVKMQCPRSSNWDPAVTNPHTGEEHINERCACCELEEWIFDTPYDPEFPDGTYVIDALTEELQTVIGKIDYRANNWDSALFFPCTITAVVDTKTKSEDGFENITYKMGGTEDFLAAVLKIKHPDFSDRVDEQGINHPRNGIPEQLVRFLTQCEDANDLTFGRWFTLTKINGGKGGNGYTLMPDPYPSPFPKERVDYNKIYDFCKWGEKTKKKPSIRLPYAQQVAILAQADWAQDLRAMDVPITDADVDMLEAGHSLVPDLSTGYQQPVQNYPQYTPQQGGYAPQVYQQPPNQLPSATGIPVSAPPLTPAYAQAPYVPPSANPTMGYQGHPNQTVGYGQSAPAIGSPFSGGQPPTQYGGFPS